MQRLFLSLFLLLASCVGPGAQAEILTPLALKTWPNVRADFEAGLADGLADGDLTPDAAADLNHYADLLGDALQARSAVDLLGIPWTTTMRPWAVRGITSAVEAGELGPNGSRILLQRVDNFTAVIVQLQGGAPLVRATRREPGPNPYIITPEERRLLTTLNTN